MAKMGTRELAQKKGLGKAQLSNAGFPTVLPVNLIASPIESAPVTAIGVGTDYPWRGPIMREGFTTDTGFLPSSHDLDGQQIRLY